MKRIIKDLSIALALITVSFGVALGAAEVALRIVLDERTQQALPYFGIDEDTHNHLVWQSQQANPLAGGGTTYPSSFDQFDRDLGWRVRAGASVTHVKPDVYSVRVTTNASGRREPPRVGDVGRAENLAVAVFGCSQTFGETVDDEFVYVSLVDETIPRARVMNFGVRGYGTDQMLLYYQQAAADTEMDLVVLAFAFYHMPRNASRFLFFAKPYFELTNESGLTLQGVPVPTFDDLMAPIRFSGILVAANRSVLLRWVWQRLRNLKWRFFYAESGYPWELTKALLEEFATVARENGHELIIMNIDESQPALEGPLTDITDALNVHLLNLGPVFREARDDEIAYAFAGDNHWTPVGHRVVAAELTRFLCQLRDETECNLAAPTTPNVQR